MWCISIQRQSRLEMNGTPVIVQTGNKTPSISSVFSTPKHNYHHHHQHHHHKRASWGTVFYVLLLNEQVEAESWCLSTSPASHIHQFLRKENIATSRVKGKHFWAECVLTDQLLPFLTKVCVNSLNSVKILSIMKVWMEELNLHHYYCLSKFPIANINLRYSL